MEAPTPLSASAIAPSMSKRLMKEIAQLEQNPPPGVACWPVGDSLMQLAAQVCGPADSPYHDGTFRLAITLPSTYPLEPPKVMFSTPIYHPNIDECGRVCLDTLNLPPKGSWSPSITIAALLTTITQLMAYPNANDGLVKEVTEICRNDRAKFDQIAREWTLRHAVGKNDGDGSNASAEQSSASLLPSTAKVTPAEPPMPAGALITSTAVKRARDDSDVDSDDDEPRRPVISDSESESDVDDDGSATKKARV